MKRINISLFVNSGWRGLIFWVEKINILGGKDRYSGWRGLIFWVERIDILGGQD